MTERERERESGIELLDAKQRDRYKNSHGSNNGNLIRNTSQCFLFTDGKERGG